MPTSKVKFSAAKAKNDVKDLDTVSSLLEKKRVPVFVSPDKLSFFVENQASHKQILTIYNPYDFEINFKVLCTAPDIYSVGEGGKGVIKQHCSSDIVVRRTNLDRSLIGVVDKLRVEIFHHERTTKKQPTLIGRKDISAALLHTSLESSQVDLKKSSLIEESKASNKRLHKFSAGDLFGGNVLLISIAVICLFALGAHTTGQEDSSSFIPFYFSLYANQKLVAAYILGLVTMAIFQN